MKFSYLIRYFALGLFIVLFSSTLLAQDYALFFACNKYERLRDLENPIRNTRQIGRILKEDFGFQVESLENPGLEEIDGKLREYNEKFKKGTFNPRGQLLIFFSGHGQVESETGFFLPSNVSPDRLKYTAIDYPYWRNFINEISCQHIMVAIDACYSVRFDPLWKSRSSNPRFRRVGELAERDKMLEDHRNTKTRIFFTSDGKGEATPDVSGFAKKFQEGLLTGGNSDGILTSTELNSELEKVRPRPYCNTFGDDEANSSFLFMYKGTPRPTLPNEKMPPNDYSREAFLNAIDCGTNACLEAFVRAYPNSPYTSTAQKQLAKLRKEERESGIPLKEPVDTSPSTPSKRVLTSNDLPIRKRSILNSRGVYGFVDANGDLLEPGFVYRTATEVDKTAKTAKAMGVNGIRMQLKFKWNGRKYVIEQYSLDGRTKFDY
ncbi:MAG: caspase family protein [Bacteroidota bacterium]